MIHSMLQIFILNVQLEFISFFIFIALLAGEFLILFIYYVKGGFQKENTKSGLNFLILVFYFIYFGLSFINLFIFIISFSILLYWGSYTYVKSEFSNKNDGLLQINYYWSSVFFYMYMLYFYFKNFNSNTPNGLIFSSIIHLMLVLWLYFVFHRYLFNKKRAVSFRNKAREELDQKKYEKALNFLKEAVQASNNIIGITKLETQLEIELNNMETAIKEGNFENLENILPEIINQKNQILTYFFVCSIGIFIIILVLIFNF